MTHTQRHEPSTTRAIVILLDVLVMFALAVRWGEAQGAT